MTVTRGSLRPSRNGGRQERSDEWRSEIHHHVGPQTGDVGGDSGTTRLRQHDSCPGGHPRTLGDEMPSAYHVDALLILAKHRTSFGAADQAADRMMRVPASDSDLMTAGSGDRPRILAP